MFFDIVIPKYRIFSQKFETFDKFFTAGVTLFFHYIRTQNNWTEKINCQATNLELYLFRQVSDLFKNRIPIIYIYIDLYISILMQDGGSTVIIYANI